MESLGGGRSRSEADAHRALSAEGLACADVTDALRRVRGHRAHITGLVSPVPTRHMFGRVITISFFPTFAEKLDSKEFNFGRLFHQAVQGSTTDPSHTVLVMASNGYTGTSLAGGTKLSRLTNSGLAGVLTDGRLRDFDELAEEPYAAWCSGEAVAWGGGEVTPFQANVPIVIGGVGVYPGQNVFCDSSGAVFIPEDVVDEVLEAAHQIRRDDASSRAVIAVEDVGDALGTER